MADFDPAPRRALRQTTTATDTSEVNPLAPRTGATSSDAVKPEKSVKVKIKVPKSLRKHLELQAAELGISVDELITRRLT